MTNTKQLKITKLFRKGAKLPEDCEELQEEINQLELKLKEKQDELFQLQRNSYRHKASPIKTITEPKGFGKIKNIVLSNAVDKLKNDLELMSVLSGIEVQSFVADDHCSIIYHMQHAAEHQVKHGLRIELNSGGKEISKSSLPLGFNLDAVMEEFDNIMLPNCLGAIRKALVAYYNRLEQFEALKKMLKMEAQLFKIMDGSHIKVEFVAQSDLNEDAEPFDIVLMLDYRVYDIRPKHFSFEENDLPEGAVDMLREQCMIFKKKPLHKAFKEAFIDSNGCFKLVEQFGTHLTEPSRRRPKRSRPNKHDYRNDDTFLPEDCSEHSDEGDIE